MGRLSEHAEGEEGRSRARRGGRRRWKAIEQRRSSETRAEGGEKIRRWRINSERKGVRVRSSLMRNPGDASGGRK